MWKSQDFHSRLLESRSCRICSLCRKRQRNLWSLCLESFPSQCLMNFIPTMHFSRSYQMRDIFSFRSTPFLISCCSLRFLSLVGHTGVGGGGRREDSCLFSQEIGLWSLVLGCALPVRAFPKLLSYWVGDCCNCTPHGLRWGSVILLEMSFAWRLKQVNRSSMCHFQCSRNVPASQQRH